MKIEEIHPGQEYIIKTEVTGQFISKVLTRNRGDQFPFEATAANFGLLSENIIRPVPADYFTKGHQNGNRANN
jgi:hypothetical protein